MSHFAVILVIEDVISTDPTKFNERIESEMAPFMENCCGEPDKIYMKFYDMEDEYLKTYEEGTIEKVVMPDGRLLLPWDEAFKVKPKKGEFPFPSAKAPPDLPRRMVPYKELFSTFEEFVKEWHGREERDETYNRYGYWQNPNAKWDWFEIGGRWSGFFQLKPGREGALGRQYNFSGELGMSNGGKADVCFKGAIDFEAMRTEAAAVAVKTYDAVWKAIKGTSENELWQTVMEKHPNNIEAARKEYHAQPRVKAFQNFCGSEEGREMVGFFSNVEDFNIPRDQYIANAISHVAVPFAVLRHGKWYEQGNMGWFGMASNEKDPETWNAVVSKLMNDLSEDTMLVVIDCHI